jgi:hypothetical protein
MTFRSPHFDRSPDQNEKAILADAAHPLPAYACMLLRAILAEGAESAANFIVSGEPAKN